MNNCNKGVKLLYSVSKEHLSSKERQHQSVSINDILKSVQILEDADKTVTKKRNKTNFGTLSNKFITLSSLQNFRKNECNTVTSPDVPSHSSKDPDNGLNNESNLDKRACSSSFPLLEEVNPPLSVENIDKRKINYRCEHEEINNSPGECKYMSNSDETEQDNNFCIKTEELAKCFENVQEENNLNNTSELKENNLLEKRCSLNSVTRNNEFLAERQLSLAKNSVKKMGLNENQLEDVAEEDNERFLQKNQLGTILLENSEQICNKDILIEEEIPQTSYERNINDTNLIRNSLSPWKVENELYGFTYTQLFNEDFINNSQHQNSAKNTDLDKFSGPLEVLSRNKGKCINFTSSPQSSGLLNDSYKKPNSLIIERTELIDDGTTSVLPQSGSKGEIKLADDGTTLLSTHKASGGKRVRVNTKSLDKVGLLFNDDEHLNALVEVEKEKISKNRFEEKKEVELKDVFTTAAGKPVKVDDNILSKVRLLFKDDADDIGDVVVNQNDNFKKNMLEQDEIQVSKNSSSFVFSTAGGKPVKDDTTNLEKVRLLLNDNVEDTGHITTNQNNSPLFRQRIKETKPFPFSTAGGKSFQVNPKSLDKVRSLFNEDAEANKDIAANKSSSLTKTIFEQNQPHFSKTTPHLFSTAGGKSVEDAEVNKNKSLTNIECELKQTHSSKTTLFAFSAAGGKSIKMDSKSLDKARLLFEEDNLHVIANQNNSLLLKTDTPELQKETKPLGFSTAAGKSVNVDPKILDEVKLLFKNDAEDIEAVTTKISDSCSAGDLKKNCARELKKEGFSKTTPFPFSTASGKSVEIDSRSLDRVRMLFDDDLDNIGHDAANLNDPALLKNIQAETMQEQKIEEGALEYTDNERVEMFSKTLDNIKTLNEDSMENKLVYTNKSNIASSNNAEKKDPHFSGGMPFMFSTASGKTVNVDSKSIDKVRLLFEEVDGNASANQNNKSLKTNQVQKTKPVAFSTAGGKSVKVDPESLYKVRSLFKEEDATGTLLKSNDTSSRNNLGPHKPLKKNLTLEQASTSIQSGFHISDEDIAELNAGDMEKFSTFQDAMFNSKESLVNSETVINADQISAISRNSVNKSLFKEELTAAIKETDSRLDDAPVSLNQEEEDKCKHLKLLDKNSSSEEKEDIFGSNSLNYIMLLLNEEEVTRNSKESDDVGAQYMPGNAKVCNVSGAEQNQTLNVNEAKIDSFVADINVESFENEAVVPSYNLYKNEGDLNIESTNNTKVPDNKITLEEANNRELIGSVANSDSDNDNTQMSGMSIFHEVSESAAALLVDEQHNGTWRTRGIVTSPSMCAERTRPNVSIVTLNDCQKAGFTTITNRMANLAYTPKRIKPNSEKRKIYNSGENEYNENKKPKVELFPKQQIIELCNKSQQHQREIINQKFKTIVKPEASLLFIQKQKSDRISLKKAVGGLCPKIYTEEQLLTFGLKKQVIDITANNSSSFQFDAKYYYREDIRFFSTGLQVGQESFLLFNSDSKGGLAEIIQCFLANPGVDPKLVPDGWVANHYRWIIWKLASMEKSFPEVFGGRCLNPENILLQLKYRYDREIDRAQRSAFKKISEGDESPSRLFICCIAAIRNNDSEINVESSCDLELTDGWYSLWSSVDDEMKALINKGRVRVGSKLAIMGAESLNPDQANDPLKAGKECRLKICTNSCRLARWDAKMGFVNSRCLPSVKLSSVLPHGGMIGKTIALVARVYPLLHMSKDSEGKTVFRNERTESAEEARNEKIYNEKAEELYEQVWREVEQKYKKTIDVGMYTSKDIKTLSQPDILWSLIELSCDSATQVSTGLIGDKSPYMKILEVWGLLSTEQLKSVADYREQIVSKMREEVQDLIKVKMKNILPERHVVKLLKVRLVDSEKEMQALLTIWRPTEEICRILKENKMISFTHLYASGSRERVLQLTNTRQTRYQEVSSLASNSKFLRRVTCLSELKPVGVTRPTGLLSSEIDVVGLVVHIKHPDHPKGLTVIYLTNLEGEYLAISFWTALKVFGCEDILTEDSLVCCSNLQWRSGSGAWRIPNVFATELSVFAQLPKFPHLKQEFSKIKSLLSSEKTSDRMAEHKLRLLTILKKREYASVGGSPSAAQMEHPTTSATENQADVTPVQKKIKKLSNYGRPPPLAPLPLFSRSPEVFNNFRSPWRAGRSSPKTNSSSVETDQA